MIKRLRHIPKIVYAMQWTGKQEDAEEMSTLISRKLNADEIYATGSFSLDTSEGWLYVFPNNWVIKDADGDLRVCNFDDLDKNYEVFD